MEFEFTGRHIEITPAVEKLVRKELGKLDLMLDSAPIRAHVIVSAEKHRKRTEIVVHWRDICFHGHWREQRIWPSRWQPRPGRFKSRGSASRRDSRRRSAVASRRARSRRCRAAPIEAAPNAPRIIAQRRYRVKPMTPEEAAIILTDSDDQFIVFRDAETNKVGVLYNRTDGNYGLIEP